MADQHDDEVHKHAPADEDRIRADERARTERDIAAWVTSEDPAHVDVRSSWLALGEPIGPNWIAAVVERSEYPRLATDIIDAALATDAPPEPAAPDPWPLPEGLTWRYQLGWLIETEVGHMPWGMLWLEGRQLLGSLQMRDDAEHMIDLLRRRNAAERKGPA